MQINIHSKIKDYTLHFSRDFWSDLAEIKPKIVIADSNVLRLYQEKLSVFDKDEIITFNAVEQNKNMNSVFELCDKVMSYSAKKNITIISFGGGITQDVTGFLSSVLYRGVNWVFVPTTLLAQADSCMGSKTSLNYKHFKNLLGSFYPPSQVFIDTEFTKTLTEVDFYSGLGEIVKLHLMGTEQHLLQITDALSKDIRNDDVLLDKLVRNSLQIKYSYIKDDEFDTGRRNLLNFGHDFGHALETTSNYKIPHGIAVVLGMIFANKIAVKRGLLDNDIAERRYEQILSKCIKCPLQKEYFDKQGLLTAMKMDKKRVGDGLPLIVLKNNFELEKLLDITPEELFWGIDEMQV
ncbi:MAG: iron-containing alcohol dehydrogenase [Prevotellaceae bacterium]|jgi:3-dehydroquinate synthase|nr:iron-containing alcohol dehydrogenase [Prevotellaceae bacterium]